MKRLDMIVISRTKSGYRIIHGKREYTPIAGAPKSGIYYKIVKIAEEKLNGKEWQRAAVIPTTGTARKLILLLYHTADYKKLAVISDLLDGRDFDVARL